METKNTIIAAILLALLLAETQPVYAASDDITVRKTAASQIRAGDILEVTIHVQNNDGDTIEAEIREYMVDAETIEAPNKTHEVGAQPKMNATGGGIAWFDPYYKWIVSLGPGEEKRISYKIRPNTIGPLMIGPTEVITNKGTYYSNALQVVVKCNANKVCEGTLKENSVNCPEDCPAGFADSICNAIQDGICDPDCPANMDPDCFKAVCGDGKCEKSKGENYQTCPQDCKKPLICGDSSCEREENYANCPQDCPSGGADGYCDALKDNKCDPDCPTKIDPDCTGACGNGICDVPNGENHRTCEQDCPSGIKDNYCDSLKDNKCDPDCAEGIDPDCSGDNTLLYIILAFAAATITLFIYARIKKRS